MLFCYRKRKPKNDLLWKKTYNKYTRKRFPQKTGGAPHPFFEGKALGTGLEGATKKFEQDPSDSNLNTLNEAKEILESYDEEKTKGVIIRARARCLLYTSDAADE